MGLRGRIREFFGLEGNLLPIVISELSSNVGWNMFDVIWQPYVLSMGASVPILGALDSLRVALTSVLQPLMGRLSDSFGRKTLIYFSYAFTLLGLLIIILTRSWLWLIPVMILWAFSDSLWEPIFPALVSESVSVEKRGTAFSVWSMTWFIPGFFAPALGGYLAYIWGYQSIMIFIFVGESLAALIFALYVKETFVSKEVFSLSELLRSFGGLFKLPSGLQRFYSVSIISRFAWLMGEGLLFAMLLKTYGFNMIQLGVLANALSLSVIITQIPVGRLVDRYGSKPFLIISRVVWALCFLGYLLARDFTGFIVVRVVRGLSVSTWEPAHNTYLANSVADEQRSKTYGDLNCLRGLICFPAPIVGALLYETYGFTAPIMGGLILVLVVIILLVPLEER
jgi:MFS family permease